jgi:hypothetical protein
MKRPTYPVQDILNGRLRYGVDSKGQPAKDYEKVTGWVGVPEDHRKKRRK